MDIQHKNRSNKTQPLNVVVKNTVANINSSTDQDMIQMRAAVVKTKFKSAIEKVYREKAGYILNHINAVYIIKEQSNDGVEYKKLVIYSDDSLIRSDLDAKQEYIKIAFKHLQEDISQVTIFASKGGMRQRKPYKDCVRQKQKTKATKRQLTKEEALKIDNLVNKVEDDVLKLSVKTAIETVFKNSKNKHI